MMLNNNPYSEVKGFNYWPSYAMVLNDVMDRFDLEIVKRELKGAQNLGASCVRVWVSNVSWQRSAPRFLSDFRALLSAAESYGILVMPVLFNRWVDTDYPVGELDLTTVMMPLSGANREYLRSFLGEFRNDSRILMWDLCNEPFYYALLPLEESAIQEIKRLEIRYWQECLAEIRRISPSQPVTMGFAGPADQALEELYRSLDVISFHPYAEYWDEGFLQFTDAYIDVANRLEKPLLCTETCQGSLNDQVRGEIVRQTLDALDLLPLLLERGGVVRHAAWAFVRGKGRHRRPVPSGRKLPARRGRIYALPTGRRLDPAASRGGAALHQAGTQQLTEAASNRVNRKEIRRMS